MSINEIIVYLMVVFMALGAVDRILGNRFGLGEKFEEGIMAMGSLALAMIGIICLAPVLANLLRPVVVPLYQALGADPAMFAGTLLANDMGGAPLAQELALTQEAGQFGGLIVGSMLGPTIVFTIPVGLGIIKAEDRPYLATGVLAGVITIPIGSFAGGLAAGFPVGMVLRNLIPIALFAVLIALGLAFLPNGMVKGFQVFGRIIVIIITIGLAAAGRARRVLGVEFNPSAARCAAQNARANGAGNARFLCADATACLQGMAARGERADVVFLDPPRAGSTPEFLGAVDRMGPERIVYISCNPETQRRDLRLLAGWGWRARLLQPVDLFPHTEHVECVAVLAKIRGGGM